VLWVPYNIIETERFGKKLIFIDILGLKVAKGDENDIKELANAIVEHPNFRAFFFNFTKIYRQQNRWRYSFNTYKIYGNISNRRFLEVYYYN